MVMEAEKSHNLLSIEWRPREAGGIVQSESEGLRTREANGVDHSLRAGEDEMICPRSSRQAGSKK